MPKFIKPKELGKYTLQEVDEMRSGKYPLQEVEEM
jgi:hypothetical protein